MIIGKSNEDEIKYLNKTIETIDELLAACGHVSKKQDSELKNDRKFLWDSMKEMDDLEVSQLTDDLLRQEKNYISNQKKIHTLTTQRNAPYFSRIDFLEKGEDEAESLYIGISSVMNDDFDFLVLDWRSPISNMFYDFEMGEASYTSPNGKIEGEIVLNRQYNIKNSEIKFIHEANSTLHDESLLDVLSSNTSDKMKNIVSSIQKKQNEIIRNDKAKVLLLQGVAGSGKTSIAMHRAAYLLYKNRKVLKADNILIFSPNDVFSDYIADVLPGLGEDNIQQTTLSHFTSKFLPSINKYESKNHQLEYLYSGTAEDYATRIKSMQFKNSNEFTDILEKYCSKLPESLPKFKAITLDNEVVMPKKQVESTFLNRFKDVPFIDRIDSLKESIISQVETKYLLQSKNKNASDFGYDYFEEAGKSFHEYLEERIGAQIDEMFPTINPVHIYGLLWDKISTYTSKDINDVKEYTQWTLGSDYVRYEDIIPITYLRAYMEGFRNYGNIKHIIIDECQDYSPLFYKLIQKSFKNASATILGDLNQRINGYNNLNSKEEISLIFGQENTEIMTLNKSYRSTLNITDFAKGILKVGEPIEGVQREGLIPQVYSINHNIEVKITSLIEEIKDRGYSSIAVICKTGEKSKMLFDKLSQSIPNLNLIINDDSHYSRGVSIMPSYISKGLEFDAVIIPDGDNSYSKESERNLLYTVCTRALHELHIFTEKELSPLVPNGQGYEYN